jgi:hypothetical protein
MIETHVQPLLLASPEAHDQYTLNATKNWLQMHIQLFQTVSSESKPGYYKACSQSGHTSELRQSQLQARNDTVCTEIDDTCDPIQGRGYSCESNTRTVQCSGST